MSPETLALLAVGIFLIAVLYSSVGHAGASGYIALMSLASLAPAEIKPAALALNILVASITTVQFVRAGHFSWRLFWPFALLAVPASFAGGYLNLPLPLFKMMLGGLLIYSGATLLFTSPQERPESPPRFWVSVIAGAAIGLVAGLTGTGGGIFLTPLLLLSGWARAKHAAAVSAPFVLLNSVAGLLGNLTSTQNLPPSIGWLLLAAACGGLVGSHLGSRRLAPVAIKRFLAAVLFIAGAKLIFT